MTLPVLGASWDLEAVVAEHGVEQVIVTFSKAPHDVLLRSPAVARSSECELRSSPSLRPHDGADRRRARRRATPAHCRTNEPERPAVRVQARNRPGWPRRCCSCCSCQFSSQRPSRWPSRSGGPFSFARRGSGETIGCSKCSSSARCGRVGTSGKSRQRTCSDSCRIPLPAAWRAASANPGRGAPCGSRRSTSSRSC